MRTSEIAKRFLAYFEKHGHLVTTSASLISPNPTTLFTIAGMVPFIPSRRADTSVAPYGKQSEMCAYA